MRSRIGGKYSDVTQGPEHKTINGIGSAYEGVVRTRIGKGLGR